MRLSKNKILKLLNGKNQSRKKMKKTIGKSGKEKIRKNRKSFRKKKPLNLRYTTIKHYKKASKKKVYIGGNLIVNMVELGDKYFKEFKQQS